MDLTHEKNNPHRHESFKVNRIFNKELTVKLKRYELVCLEKAKSCF